MAAGAVGIAIGHAHHDQEAALRMRAPVMNHLRP
jgi:hypothetical protein